MFYLIHKHALIHRLNLSLSCSTISLASQFIIWLFWQTWSVMADLWCSLVEALRVDLVKFLSEIFSASFLCSVILVPSCLPVSPIYTFSHWLHGISYTTPAFFCFSTLSFGWTKTCLRVVWGLTTVATLCLVNIRCCSVLREWVDMWDSHHFSWLFLCFIFVGFIFSHSFLSVHLLFDLLYRPIWVTTSMEGCSYVFFLLFTVFFFRDDAVTPFQ